MNAATTDAMDDDKKEEEVVTMMMTPWRPILASSPVLHLDQFVFYNV